MDRDAFGQVLDEVRRALSQVVGRDWSDQAGTLEWTCRQTVDHLIDCLFSYAVQVAARAQSGFLPLTEVHALPEAPNGDLVTGLLAAGQIFADVVSCAPPGTRASDGVLSLDLGDWYARAAYELALHTHDVLLGLGVTWELTDGLCTAITASPALWMFDRGAVDQEADPWADLLAGSGRPAHR